MLVVGLVALLQQDAGVQAAMGARTDNTTGIFAEQVPEGTPGPVVVYGYSYEKNEMTMDGPEAFTMARIEFSSQGNGYLQAKMLMRAVRKCFENWQGVLSDGSDVDSIHRVDEMDGFEVGPFQYKVSAEFQVAYRDLSSP